MPLPLSAVHDGWAMLGETPIMVSKSVNNIALIDWGMMVIVDEVLIYKLTKLKLFGRLSK